MKKHISLNSIIFFFCILGSLTLQAQQATIQSAPLAGSDDGYFVVYGKGMVMYGKAAPGSNGRIPYNRINGSPFLIQEYQNAEVFDGKGSLGMMPCKINFYTQELYFRNAIGEERVAEQGVVTKVVFKPMQGSSGERVFQTGIPVEKIKNTAPDKDQFVQVLNQGNQQLLKYGAMQFIVADSLMGSAKRYYFSFQFDYYLKNGSTQSPVKLKKLSRDIILDELKSVNGMEVWLREQKINFKKEEDVLRFLDWYNQQPQN